MCDFSKRCTESRALLRLRHITLTIDAQTASEIPKWLQRVEALLPSSPIEVFQIYSTFTYFDTGSMVAMNEFCSKIVSTHGHRLTRFSVHRMRIGMDAIIDICLRCMALEQLFVVAHSKELVRRCARVICHTDHHENMTGSTYHWFSQSVQTSNCSHKFPSRGWCRRALQFSRLIIR
jgi:hypothetical protein